MASEATLVIETEVPLMFTCADGAGIAKGAILTLSDPMTAALCTADAAHIAGIAAEEKIANDGNTKIAVYRRGIFKVLAGGAVAIGVAVNTYAASGATNEVYAAAAGHDTQMGIALEAADDEHTFLMELNPTCRDEA